MGDFRVAFRASAAKELRRLPLSVQVRIERTIDRLTTQPRNTVVRKLKGLMDTYRVRIGGYRVVFEIDDENRKIVVTKVRHRKEAYD